MGENFEFMDSVMALNCEVYTIYQNIEKLELSGEVESQEYDEVLNGLNYTIEEADNELRRCISITEREELNRYFNNIIGNFKDELNACLNDDPSTLVGLRLASRIPCFSSVGEKNKNKAITAIREDFIKTLLYLLNSYLNDSNYQSFIPFLTHLKNNFSFLYPEIEQDFLANKFRINPELYWSGESLANFYGMNQIERIVYTHSFATVLTDISFGIITKLNYNKPLSKKDSERFLFAVVILRASLMFLGDKRIEDIRTLVASIKNTNEEERVSDACFDIILEIINGSGVDRQKPIKVTVQR